MTSQASSECCCPVGRAALPPGIKAGNLRMDPVSADGLSCPGCATSGTRILLTLTDGTPVDVVPCRSCDYRAWRAIGGTLELAGVRDGLTERRRRH